MDSNMPSVYHGVGKIHENGKYEFTGVIVKFEADRLSCEIKGQTH